MTPGVKSIRLARTSEIQLGAAGMLPGDPRAVTRDRLESLRAMGLAGASWHLASAEVEPSDLRRVATLFEETGLALAQLAPPAYPSLVDPDADARAAGLRLMERMIGHARFLGAPSLYLRPGTLNPKGGWTPHPDNHRPETVARLIDSLRALARRADDEGVILALEGHVVSTVDTPERTREILDAVGSPSLQFNMDPVNFVATIDDAYDPGPLLDRLFGSLGRLSVVAHLKDVDVEERLVVHIRETVPGRGRLNLADFLRRWRNACPAGWCLIEHLSFDDLPEAVTAVRAAERKIS